jgi:ketosteroid isomerase-like protein
MSISFIAPLECPPALAAASPPSSAALEIAAQERAFAAMCVAKGMRASFSEYFAPDAIDFEPQPAPAAASLSKNPDASAPFTLDWEPWIADASAAGDLGWDTGPYRLTPRDPSKPAGHGWFFSVWRRQSDGRWKVAMDVGTKAPGAPGPLRPAQLVAPSEPPAPGSRGADASAETAALLVRDRESASSASADALWLPAARLHRDGSLPVAGVHLIAEQTAHRGPFRTTPAGGGVSASGDLGYTYGSYVITGLSADAGYYARVWRKTANGVWKIAAQVERPGAPEKK